MLQRFIVAIFALCLATGVARAEQVDLELILAVDCSGSVDADEFALQARGFAEAFVHPRVVAAIRSGQIGAIAVTYVQWSGPQYHQQTVGWTRIHDAATAEAFAARVMAGRRFIFGGGTSVSGAIDNSRPLFGRGGFEGMRRVIDISGDGVNSSGRDVRAARDDAVSDGVVINGLPILTEFRSLDQYFREEVIGGPGAFVIPAENFSTFAAAILNKLVREIAAVPDIAGE